MEIIETMPSFRKGGGGGARRYPWDEWFDGRVRTATRGVDFENDPAVFAVQVRTAARRRGMKACVLVRGNRIHFQSHNTDTGGE